MRVSEKALRNEPSETECFWNGSVQFAEEPIRYEIVAFRALKDRARYKYIFLFIVL